MIREFYDDMPWIYKQIRASWGRKFQRNKNYKPKKEFAHRMCTSWLVARCHVMWCDFRLLSCDVMRCRAMCSHVMWCHLMWFDAMRWDGMSCACDVMWVVVRFCYVIRSGCLMWWIGRGSAVTMESQWPYDKCYKVRLRTTKYLCTPKC